MTSTVPAISNPLSARFVATWEQDCSGWAVERHEPGPAPDSAEAYMDGLPTRSPSTVLASFLGQASPMAVFELDCDGVRKAVGLKLMSVSSNPVMVRQLLTGRTEMCELDRVHPVLGRLDGLGTYYWGTPAFLDLCEVMGLDPAGARPHFRPCWEEVAEELLRWSCSVAHTTGGSWQSPQGETRRAVSELLAMMRAEARPSLRQLDSLRELWELMDRTGIPRFDELVGSSPPMCCSARRRSRTPARRSTALRPWRAWTCCRPASARACRTSISGYWGAKPSADWPGDDDAALRGIAIMPEGDALWEQAWLRDAVGRLREGNMLLLSMDEARAYLASDEAAYWVWRAGGTPRWPQVRRPTITEQLRWRVWPPLLPRDRALAALAPRHRAAAAGR